MAMGGIGVIGGMGMSSSENLGLIYKRISFYHKRGDYDTNNLNAVVDDFVNFSVNESVGELITLSPSYPYYSEGIRGIVYDGEQFTLYCDISFYLNHAFSVLSTGYIVDIIISSNENHLKGDFPYYSDLLCDYRIIFQIDMSNFKLKRESNYSNINNFFFTNDVSYSNMLGVSVNNINSSNFDFSNLKDCGIKVDVYSITLNFIIASQSDFSHLDNYVNQFKSFMLDDKSKNISLKSKFLFMNKCNYLINLSFIDMDKEFSIKYLDEFLNKLESSFKTFKRRGLKIVIAHNIDGYNRSSCLFNSILSR